MKYLLITALILGIFWFWRHKQQAAEKPPPTSKPRQAALHATEIVACEVCHVHLPKIDALMGDNGFYCSPAHRRQAQSE